MENLTILKETVINAYSKANEANKDLLENLFGTEVFVETLMDRIKTLDDALEYNGVSKSHFEEMTKCDTDGQRAGKELEQIAKALREGKPLRMDQEWYYPYFKRTLGSFSFCTYCCHDGAGIGARLSVDSSDKAIYMGKQFVDIYNRYLTPEK